MATIETRLCKCGHIYEILIHGGESINMDDDTREPICPKCGKDDFKIKVSVGTGIELGDEAGHGKHYPYFDRSLGVRVSSAAHRKKICKERGLTPIDGDFNPENKKETAFIERADKRWKDLQDRYDNSPEFADYRRLRDKGFYKDEARRQKNAGRKP